MGKIVFGARSGAGGILRSGRAWFRLSVATADLESIPVQEEKRKKCFRVSFAQKFESATFEFLLGRRCISLASRAGLVKGCG